MTRLILFNKPFGVLSQFRADGGNDYATLTKFFSDPTLRVAGRLDATSEGLLLLTNDGKLNSYLTSPKTTHDPSLGKTYWVQVAGVASDEQIAKLQQGVQLKEGKTRPAYVKRLGEQDVRILWQAPEGVGKRRVTSWLCITIFEGKNRQIRRMTASVGLPCLRLVRVGSHGLSVFGIGVGDFVVADTATITRLLAHS